MPLQPLLINSIIRTVWTRKRSLSSMSSDVVFQRLFCYRTVGASITCIRFLFCVSAQMVLEISSDSSGVGAVWTLTQLGDRRCGLFTSCGASPNCRLIAWAQPHLLRTAALLKTHKYFSYFLSLLPIHTQDIFNYPRKWKDMKDKVEIEGKRGKIHTMYINIYVDIYINTYNIFTIIYS